jgi:hypothetical protein
LHKLHPMEHKNIHDFEIHASTKVVFLKLGLSCRSCQIMVLVLPTHVFEEAIFKTSKIHNLFIHYPNNTYFSALESITFLSPLRGLPSSIVVPRVTP